MTRHFTVEENRAWQKTLATKTISALCLFVDPADKLLVVKPTYKPGWSLVGGVADDQESPIAAMVRETTEEIGLTLAPERFSFLGTKYNAPRNGFNDSIVLLFTAILSASEIADIVLQSSELEEMRWVDEAEAESLGLRDSMVAGMTALREGPGYIEGPDIVVAGHKRTDQGSKV